MIIIGIKTKDNIYVGSISNTFTLPSAGYQKDNFPVFTPDSHKDLIVAFGGGLLDSNLFKYRYSSIDKIEGDFELEPHLIVNEICTPFIKSLYEFKFLNDDKEFESTYSNLILAKGDKLYAINSNMFVAEASDYVCLGDGKTVAEAVLTEISNKNDPIYRILKATMLVIDAYRSEGNYPIIIKSLQNTAKTLVFSYEDALKYVKNYERKVGVK